MPSSKPHVIYILSDEHRGQAMSHLGDPNVQTPVMDRMAAEGASFARAYANCPICTPSRGTIFSGRHAHAGAVQNFWDVYKPTAPSIATVLRQEGYRTAYFGKWHLGTVRDQTPPAVREHPEDYPNHMWRGRTLEYHRGGFEDWFAFEVNNKPFDGFYYHNHEINPRRLKGYQTDALTDLAIQYLQEYDRDQPLFLVLSIEPPHFPLKAPERFCRHDPASLQLRGNVEDTEYWRGLLATYYAMIENLDWNMGRLFDALATMPKFADTLSVYFSDHGDFMGSHGLGCRKEHPHEESVRIPSIFHWPGKLPAQGTVDGLFSLVDLLPTTLGLLGMSMPPWAQGTDFSPKLRGEPFDGPERVLLEMAGSPRWNYNFPDWRGLVTDRWKYCHYETGIELLFDLQNDPYELHNLVAENPGQRSLMRDELLQELSRTREPYFDVLMEHAVPMEPTIHIGKKHNDSIAALLRDVVQEPVEVNPPMR